MVSPRPTSCIAEDRQTRDVAEPLQIGSHEEVIERDADSLGRPLAHGGELALGRHARLERDLVSLCSGLRRSSYLGRGSKR